MNRPEQSKEALSRDAWARALAGRFALWSAAMLALVVAAGGLMSAARPQGGALVLAIAGAQAAAVLACLALTLRPESRRMLHLGSICAWALVAAGWAWWAAETHSLSTLAGLLFVGQAGSALLLAWAPFWQAILSAGAVVAFLAAATAQGTWNAGEIAALLFVLLGGGVGREIAATLRRRAAKQNPFSWADQTSLQHLFHEIRSPAGAIAMRVELLRDQVTDAPTRGALEAIGAAAQRILNLTDNLSDAFQIETGDLRSQPRSVDLNSVVESTAAELAASALSRQVKIEMALDPALPPLDVDPRHLKRVTANLLDNAVKFTPKGGRVTVSTAASSPWVTIAFKDGGPGLDPRKEVSLFAPRRRLLGWPRPGGLGLFVARTMTELCGGKLVVESAPGEGATFIVSIPQRAKRGPGANTGGAGS